LGVKRPPLGEAAIANTGLFTVDGLIVYNPDVITYETKRLMRRDDQVKSALALKKFSVLSTPWKVVPAQGGNGDHVRHADFVRYVLLRMERDFEGNLLEILSALDFGFSLTELVLTRYEDGPYAGAWGLRALKTRSPRDITFRVDKHGNILEIQQLGVPLPRNKFVLYSYFGEFDNPYGTSDLIAAYRPWWLKENTYRWLGILLERYGIPPWIVKYQKGKVSPAEFDAVKTLIQRAQASTAALVPDTFSFDFPQVVMQGADVFLKAIGMLDAAIARAILLPQQLGFTQEVKFGSFAKAELIFGMFMWVLNYIRRDLSESVIGPQIIKPLVDWNFGEQDLYPTLQWEPLTQEISSELINLFLAAVDRQVVTPQPVDEQVIREKLGFPATVTQPPLQPGEVLPAEEAQTRLRNILTRQRDELARFVTATKQVEDLRLKFLRDIQIVFRELMRSAADRKRRDGLENQEVLRFTEDRASELTSRLKSELMERVRVAMSGDVEDIPQRLKDAYAPFVAGDGLKPYVEEALRVARGVER
jgi:phage gp29-like protein